MAKDSWIKGRVLLFLCPRESSVETPQRDSRPWQLMGEGQCLGHPLRIEDKCPYRMTPFQFRKVSGSYHSAQGTVLGESASSESPHNSISQTGKLR